jgi:hypothetical protein
MSKGNELTMPESLTYSQACASALLDAYCRNDESQMSKIAAEARMMGTCHAIEPLESERLELLGGIAIELHGASSHGDTGHLDPFVRLLLHLAHPEWLETCFAHHD